jgi:hypothetical protein
MGPRIVGPCKKCIGGLLFDVGEITLNGGWKTRDVHCFKCGATPHIEPKCTEPTAAEPFSHVLGIARERPPKPPKEYAPTSRPGTCVNCGRHMAIIAWGLCKFCYKRRDRLDEARADVEAGTVWRERHERQERNRRIKEQHYHPTPP